jgi:hypothetical protein
MWYSYSPAQDGEITLTVSIGDCREECGRTCAVRFAARDHKSPTERLFGRGRACGESIDLHVEVFVDTCPTIVDLDVREVRQDSPTCINDTYVVNGGCFAYSSTDDGESKPTPLCKDELRHGLRTPPIRVVAGSTCVG